MSGNEVAGYMTARKRYYYDRRPMELSGKHLENIPFGYFTSCLQSKHHSNADEQRPKILVAKGAPFHSLISEIQTA